MGDQIELGSVKRRKMELWLELKNGEAISGWKKKYRKTLCPGFHL